MSSSTARSKFVVAPQKLIMIAVLCVFSFCGIAFEQHFRTASSVGPEAVTVLDRSRMKLASAVDYSKSFVAASKSSTIKSTRVVVETTTTRSSDDGNSNDDNNSNQNNDPTTTTATTATTTKKNSGKFAYAFVVGGCDPVHNPASYRNYLYDMLIAARILQSAGSRADVIAFFQMSYGSAAENLTAEDLRLLAAMNITVYNIPKSETESFYSISLDKFRVLSLTEYDRVMFFDSDIMPLGSLDYVMELSYTGVLKENVVVAARMAPVNAGFFVVTPSETALRQVETIIQTKEDRDDNNNKRRKNNNKKLHFDKVRGWGHVMSATDPWISHEGSGTLWDYNGAEADQGLLYYYTKYHRQSVSIINGSAVHNWGPAAAAAVQQGDHDDDGTASSTVVLQETLHNPFAEYAVNKHRDVVVNCASWSGPAGCYPPMSEYMHFAGHARKPWKKGPPADLSADTAADTADHLWFWTLHELSLQLRMEGMDVLRHWEDNKPASGPPLGTSPKTGRHVARGRNVTLSNSILVQKG